MSWRETVYSGSLRPSAENRISGAHLDRLLTQLNYMQTNEHLTSCSRIHSINKIDNGIYLGDKYSAKDKSFLMANGITHVLNCAEGRDEYQVDTNEHYYRNTPIKYFGIPGHDRPSWNISVYFEAAARFIDQAVKSGGKVLIHCVVGVSRSATILLAYLMIHRGMDAAMALQYVFKRRRVYPNIGFLNHLAQLNNVLIKRRTFATTPTQARKTNSVY